MITICITCPVMKSSALRPHGAFLCFVWLFTITSIIVWKEANWLIFVPEVMAGSCAEEETVLVLKQKVLYDRYNVVCSTFSRAPNWHTLRSALLLTKWTRPSAYLHLLECTNDPACTAWLLTRSPIAALHCLWRQDLNVIWTNFGLQTVKIKPDVLKPTDWNLVACCWES